EGVSKRVEAALLKDKDVDAVFSEIGRRAAISGVEEEKSGINTALLNVQLKAHGSTKETIARVRARLKDVPATALTFESGEATALGKLLGGGDADLSVRVRGNNMDAALAYARLLEGKLNKPSAVATVRLG